MENKFGKVSKLHLEAVKKDNKTILTDISFTAPLKVMRPFYENGRMSVMMLAASAGIMAGDRQEITFCVREGAQMDFVSQAYEKIHRMEEGFASREVEIIMEPNSSLHYTPLPTIPFQDCDYRSHIVVRLTDETSKFVMSEVLTCGRVAHGEEFLYRRFQNKISIYQGEKIVYFDNTCYEPSKMKMQSIGMYEGYTHLANLIICNEPKDDEWIMKVRTLLDETEDVEGGVTRTAVGHIVIRILGKNGDKLTKIQTNILNLY